jgi:hypothetical protein
MTIPSKNQIIIVIVLIAASFAVGRYSARANKTVVQTTQAKTDEEKDTHTRTTITDTKKPDGTDTKVEIIDQVQNDDTQSTATSQTQTTITSKSSILNISVLGANDFHAGLFAPTYGLSVTKEVLGPVTVGAFGLMNGTIGVSVGLNF